MKIFCIGRNYAAHAAELGNKAPGKPMVFMKPPTAILPNNKPFYYPEYSNDIHFECELVIKIAKNGRATPGKSPRASTTPPLSVPSSSPPVTSPTSTTSSFGWKKTERKSSTATAAT